MRPAVLGVVIVLLVGASACGGGSGKHDGGPGGTRITGTFSESINRNVDVLFLIDDSSSMKLAQDKMIRAFPAFMTTLGNAPQGLPNLHLAVVSSDMGAGDGSISSCDATGGKQGIFQSTARGTCTSTGLNAGATYIADVGGVRNYTGNLEDVFACIAALGEAGCNFEHQFAAITRALGIDGLGAPPTENQGFLRQDAALAIIMLTNEDDCSVALGDGPNGRIPLFDTGVNTDLASQLGPPINFRCNEFGHMCKTGSGAPAHPSRYAPNNDVSFLVTYDSCTSNDAEGFLLSVKDTANRIKDLKADPAQVAVMAIHGPADPYTVHWKTPTATDTSCGAASCPWPEISHSCTASDGSFGDPSVRTTALVNEFGAHGLSLPFCSDDLGPSMMRAGELINTLFGPPCIQGNIAFTPGNLYKPDCVVTEHYLKANGMVTDVVLPYCDDNGNVAPCWGMNTDPTCFGGNVLMVSPDPAIPATASATISYSCRPCVETPTGIDCT